MEFSAPRTAAGALLDERTLEVIDWPAMRERVAGLTHSEPGYALAIGLTPVGDWRDAARLAAETDEMRRLAGAGIPMARALDVDAAIDNAARGVTLAASDLRAIGDALAAAAAAARAVRESDDAPLLQRRLERFVALPQLVHRLTDAIDERGGVLDRASPELGRIRREIARAQDEARERAQALVRSARYARAIQDALVTMRDGRYVVPVKAEFIGEVPGVVHDSSASGATLFVEPLDALETNNRVRAARAREEHEIARILAALTGAVGSQAAEIRLDLILYAQLDLAHARAVLAQRMRATPATIVDDITLEVTEGRHPLLDDRAVPQSFCLDDATRVLVISGPNMGGKTVTLKLAGLCVAMAACGLHVPSERAVVGPFQRVMADIGDEQSIAQNASTFSAHLRRLAAIVEVTDDHSLVLLDEIGSGTEPQAGAALAVAVIERFVERGTRCIATTHATELKLYSAAHEHVRNASVRFDPETYAPTYQLDIGTPGQSLAFALARRMHLDRGVVARAEALLSSQERDYDRALAEVAEERTRATAERAAVERDRVHLHTLQEQARRLRETLERERKELAGQAERKLADALRAFTAELERRAAQRGDRGRARVTPGQSELLARTVEQMRRDLGIERPAAYAGDAQQKPLAVGDRVHVAAFDQDGEVVQDLGDHLLVQIGAMRASVARADVRRIGGAQRSRPPSTPPSVQLEAATTATNQLDVRGKRFVEAEPLVDAWIDESMLAGASPLRLIHGKGTGLLGRGLQEYLKSHAHVRGVRYGTAEEGGTGVTMFELA